MRLHRCPSEHIIAQRQPFFAKHYLYAVDKSSDLSINMLTDNIPSLKSNCSKTMLEVFFLNLTFIFLLYKLALI